MTVLSWNYEITPPTETAALSTGTQSLDSIAFKDLALDDDGDLAVPVRLVEGADAVAQRLRIRFRFMLREWFLDLREGIPYIEKILVMNPDLRVVRYLFRRAIVTTPGIAECNDLVLSFNRSTRRLTIESFSARLVDGSTFRLLDTPFILS